MAACMAGVPKRAEGRVRARHWADSYTSAMPAADCGHGDLHALIERQEGRIAELTASIEKMTSARTGLLETVEELRMRLVAAQRRGMRQASPFSDDRRISKPRSPGRRPGKGRFGHRRPPTAD